MKLLVLSVLVVCASCMSHPRINFEAEWKDWKNSNDKSYIEEEEVKRQMIWEQNRHFVMKHNYEYDLGKHTYRMGMNKFADLTNEEYKALYLGNFQRTGAPGCNATSLSKTVSDLPKSVDWTKQGYVTPIKNQGQCGSCWAFSTTGSVEGQHFKKTGKLVSLSEQNLMDCSKPEGDFSCEGGLMDYAFDYIIENGGIDTEASYPYKASDEQTCLFTKNNIGATISGCFDVPSQDESSLQEKVATIGPISVAIDASHISFQLYESGVYKEPQCSQTQLDHGVLAVGYGSEGGEDYWLVKNSWGTDWGKLQGYIKMSRNNNNNCGIATSASYPVV